ncbi:hypothetical protein LJC19_06430 [Oxalobacter sp. OttesenSCG-928-P03]|nr:hypothetical protein [Oxalobacter sp. OttesenSCG-928-P03]
MKYLNDLYNDAEHAYRQAQHVQKQAHEQLGQILPNRIFESGKQKRPKSARKRIQKKRESLLEKYNEITDQFGDRGVVEHGETHSFSEQEEFLRLKNIY